MSKTMNTGATVKVDFKGLGYRDFNYATARAFVKAGVTIIGTCTIPDMSHPMPYANGQRGYQVSDKGTGRILTHAELRVIASVK